MSLDQVFTEGMRAWVAEQLKRQNILNQNGANMVYTHGVHQARLLGLKEEEIAHILPYPGKNVVSVNRPAPVLPWILSAALGAGVLTYALTRPNPYPNPPEPTPSSAGLDFEVK